MEAIALHIVPALINPNDQSWLVSLRSTLQLGPAMKCDKKYVHSRSFSLPRASALPRKSDLAGLMLSECFAYTSVSLFWQLSTFSSFTSVFFVWFFSFESIERSGEVQNVLMGGNACQFQCTLIAY